MALKATRAEVWAASIEDRAGGAAEKLEALAKAGASLEMVLTRRTPENPGRGVMFVTPLKGAKAMRAAQEAGFAKPESMRAEAPPAISAPIPQTPAASLPAAPAAPSASAVVGALGQTGGRE